MDTSNFTFLVYGLLAVWLILFAFVASLAARERRLRKEIDNLKRMLQEQHGNVLSGAASMH
jgi:CcmD family protein